MQYLLLIYTNENQFEALGEGEKKKITGEYMELASSMRANGQYVGGNRLDLTSKATTVRVRDGKKLVTDGPFAETKEQLGGYFLVEANDLDEAIGLHEKSLLRAGDPLKCGRSCRYRCRLWPTSSQ